jgi:hypothetical protein
MNVAVAAGAAVSQKRKQETADNGVAKKAKGGKSFLMLPIQRSSLFYCFMCLVDDVLVDWYTSRLIY